MGLLSSDRVQFVSAILALPVFAVTLFFNYASSDSSLGIIPKSAADVSDDFEVYITPIGWAFAIWGIIYLWLAVALIYALTQLCRRTEAGPVFAFPVTLPVAFWLLFFTSMALNIGWLFAWGYEEVTLAVVLLGLLVTANCLMVAILQRRLYQAQYDMPPPTPRETLLVRLCVHNGLALYTTWTIIAFLINLDIVLVYISGASNEVVSSTLTGLLAAAIIAWLVLELTVLDKYTRWTITPGFVLVWALSAVFQKNYYTAVGSTPALIVTALVVACAALAVRLVALVVFVRRDGGTGNMSVSPPSKYTV